MAKSRSVGSSSSQVSRRRSEGETVWQDDVLINDGSFCRSAASSSGDLSSSTPVIRRRNVRGEARGEDEEVVGDFMIDYGFSCFVS